MLAVPALGCASAPPAKLDLEPARAAVEKARAAGAPEKAPEEFAAAEGHLKEAEAAATRPRQAERAACLGDLVVSEAACSVRLTQADARALAQAQAQAERLSGVQKEAAEADRLAARAKKAEEDQRRLEERVAVLARDLELTETEVIRTKARLQGLETKADATSVIAETRVQIRRTQEQHGRSLAVIRSHELLDRAEQMVEDGNFGAAAFMALKAQELTKDVRRGAPLEAGDRPAPKRQYVVVATLANLRSEPSREAAVSGRVKKGDSLEATALRGEWLQVKTGSLAGWILRALVE